MKIRKTESLTQFKGEIRRVGDEILKTLENNTWRAEVKQSPDKALRRIAGKISKAFRSVYELFDPLRANKEGRMSGWKGMYAFDKQTRGEAVKYRQGQESIFQKKAMEIGRTPPKYTGQYEGLSEEELKEIHERKRLENLRAIRKTQRERALKGVKTAVTSISGKKINVRPEQVTKEALKNIVEKIGKIARQIQQSLGGGLGHHTVEQLFCWQAGDTVLAVALVRRILPPPQIITGLSAKLQSDTGVLWSFSAKRKVL